MSLKLKVTKDEYAALAEGIRGLYEEKDDAFVLGVDGIEDTAGLKSALEKERKAARDLERLAKQYQGLGKSPEEIAELVRAQEDAEKAKLEQKGEWDKLRGQMLEKHSQDISKKDDEIKRMRSALESYLVDAAATAAIAEFKGSPLLLLPHVKNSVKVIEESGQFLVRVVAPDGTPRVNAKGEFIGIKDLVGEMKSNELFGRAFEGTGANGGGMPANQGGQNLRQDWQKLSPEQRIQAARAAGITAK